MDRLKIGEVIYRLRKEKGITQENLAQCVGVSTAAVSKWESGNSYPDITLLAPIARLFEVTIDDLMNFKEELSDDEVTQLCMEYANTFENKSLKEGLDLCEAKLKEYPNNLFLKFRIGSLYMIYSSKSTDEEEIKKINECSIDLLEKSSKSSELEIKEASYYMLSSLYSTSGEYKKAIEILKNIPKRQMDPEMMLSNIYLNQREYEKAMKCIQESTYYNLNNLIMSLGTLSIVYGNMEDTENRLYALEIQRNLIDTFGLSDLFMHNNNLNFAYAYAKVKDHEKTLRYLESTSKIISELDHKVYDLSHSKLFNKIKLMEGTISLSFLKENLKMILDIEPSFEFIRERQEYKDLYDKFI